MKVVQPLRFWKKINHKVRNLSKGVSLIESSIAIAVTATISISILSLVSSAYEMQATSQKLFLAYTLAQTKMNQILTNPVLTPGEQKGVIDTNIYKNFEYELIIKEEQMDLAKIAQTGSLKVSVDDMLPASVQNFKGKEKRGQNVTETGGLIPVYKIKLIIHYPIQGNRKGKYEIISFKSIKNI